MRYPVPRIYLILFKFWVQIGNIYKLWGEFVSQVNMKFWGTYQCYKSVSLGGGVSLAGG